MLVRSKWVHVIQRKNRCEFPPVSAREVLARRVSGTARRQREAQSQRAEYGLSLLERVRQFTFQRAVIPSLGEVAVLLHTTTRLPSESAFRGNRQHGLSASLLADMTTPGSGGDAMISVYMPKGFQCSQSFLSAVDLANL